MAKEKATVLVIVSARLLDGRQFFTLCAAGGKVDSANPLTMPLETASRKLSSGTVGMKKNELRLLCVHSNACVGMTEMFGDLLPPNELLIFCLLVLSAEVPGRTTTRSTSQISTVRREFYVLFVVTEVIKRIVALPTQTGSIKSGLDYAVSEIMPIIERLVADSEQHVRSALESNIMGLAPLLGRDMTLKHLVDVVLALLKDDYPEVLLWVIARVDRVSFLMSIDKLNSELLPAIVEPAEDKDWGLRLSIIERIATKQLGKRFFEDNCKLGELYISWLGDSVFSIREVATTNQRNLAEIFGVDWAQRHVVPQVLNMYDKSSNYCAFCA